MMLLSIELRKLPGYQLFDALAKSKVAMPESTPGFKRQMIILNAETRSFKRASIVMKRVVGLDVSPNTIERIALEVGNDLEAAEQAQWQNVLDGEVVVPPLAIIEFDGGRIRTRKT